VTVAAVLAAVCAVIAVVLSVALVLLLVVVRREAARLSGRLDAAVESTVLGALPPAQALEVVLGQVHGRSPHTTELITSLLGGEGRRLDRSDLTISERTDLEYRLVRVDRDSYQLIMQVDYTFTNRVPTDKFVIFATSDATLRDSIVLGCRQPLFELWYIPDDPVDPLFHESVDRMLPSVRIGLQFLDAYDEPRELHDRSPLLNEVRIGRWEEHLTFFREPLGDLPRLRPEEYMRSLRVFEIDLHRVVGPAAQIGTITRLRLRSMTLQRVDDGFCYWQAPYPCYLERMQIDAAGLAADGDDPFVFRLQSFAFRSQPSPARWSPPEQVKVIDVRSWLLPGHGVVLLWKESER